MATSNTAAQAFKALHRRQNRPLVLANVYDVISAETIAETSASEALGTASFAVARSFGIHDDDLTLEDNLATVRRVAAVAKKHNKPLTVDLQDGYGSQLEDAVGSLLDLEVAGINLEDYDKDSKKMIEASAAAERVKRVIAVARSRNVPDFVVNARTDVLLHGGDLNQVLERGRMYLDAGATTVFVWGAKRGVSTAEVRELVQAFDGRLNVKWIPDGLTVEELTEIGVARISVGPFLMWTAIDAYRQAANKLFVPKH